MCEVRKILSRFCPKAHLLVISNPVNSTVPIAYETLRRCGVESPSVYGITTLDSVRATTFLAEKQKRSLEEVQAVKVIGGHSGNTIIPLLGETLDDTILQRIQYGGDEVVKAKAGGGSATLAMAYAAFRFFQNFQARRSPLIAFVKIAEWKSLGYPTEYFATEIDLNQDGTLKKVHPIPSINEAEKKLLEKAVPELQKDIAKGISFATS